MQGIVLAIMISILSPEGMNGATAALCLSGKACGLYRNHALLVKHSCRPSRKRERITIVFFKRSDFCINIFISAKAKGNNEGNHEITVLQRTLMEHRHPSLVEALVNILNMQK